MKVIETRLDEMEKKLRRDSQRGPAEYMPASLTVAKGLR